MKSLFQFFLILLIGNCFTSCAGTSTWGTKDGDNDMLPDVEDEQTEYSDEIPNEFDAENDEDALKEIDANLELEEYVEELSETGESEEITESNEFKLPMFKYNLNDGNTEGLSGIETLYATSLYDKSIFMLWNNEKGIQYNLYKEGDLQWSGEMQFISCRQNFLKDILAPPLKYCAEQSIECKTGDPMPTNYWNVDVSILSKYDNSALLKMYFPHMNAWTDGDLNVHIPLKFSIKATNEGLLDLSIIKDAQNYQIAVLEDFGKDYNDAFLQRMQNGLEPSDTNTPRLGMGTFFDWGATPGGGGILYGVTGDELDTRIDWYNALYKRIYSNGKWSERKRIFTMGDAPGTLDDENDQICNCKPDRTGCSCKHINGIYPVKNVKNELIDPVILEVWRGGNKPYALIAVWANEDPVNSQIIIDSKSDYARMPNRIYGVYAFEDGQTWMALGVWETDRFNVKIVPFDESGFKFDKQIKLFEVLPRDTPNIPDYLPESYLKSSLGQPPNGRLLSFIRDEIDPNANGGAKWRLVEYKHVHSADGDTVVELTANNPPWLDQTGIMGETIVIPANNGKSILITERLRHPFDLNGDKGERGLTYRDICVYAENDQGIRENIGCPINSEGFHWSYGAAAWLEEDSSKLPMLLMGGNGNGYFSYVDTKDPNETFTMLPYSQIYPNQLYMSNGLNGSRDFVAANSYGVETFLLNIKNGGELNINKIKHFDKIEDGACQLLSIAGGLLRFVCRGKDLYSNFTYTTILCDANGNCSQPRPFSIDGFETFDTQLIKRSGDYVAVSTKTPLTSSIINFQTWKSMDDGATWTKFGEDFLAFKQFLKTYNWKQYKDGLAGVNMLAFENGTEMEYVLKGFTLEIGSGGVKWGNAEIPIGKRGAYLDIAVGANGKVFAVWRADESSKINSAIYDIERDSFSEVISEDLNLDGDISAIKPFVNDAGYCIAIEYIVAAAENVGPQQTKTIWGCNKW